jgi:hypothetical protein
VSTPARFQRGADLPVVASFQRVCCLQFDAYGNEIASALDLESRAVVEAMDAFTISVVSYANSTGTRWPFVFIPDFERRGESFNKLAHSQQVGLFPVVSENDRAAYEVYAAANQHWISDGVALQSHDENSSLALFNISESIFHMQIDAEGNQSKREPVREPRVDYGPGDYLPIWQQAPAPSNANMINYDILQLASVRRSYRVMWETRRSVLSEVMMVNPFADASTLQMDDPSTVVFRPIYSYFSNNEKYGSNEMVAAVAAVIPWKREFENILRHGKSIARLCL